MDYVTKKEFNDVVGQIFLRFDHHDQLFGLIFKKLDHIEDKLDRNIERMDLQIKELKEMNISMNARVTCNSFDLI